jgi:hypothetical protein
MHCAYADLSCCSDIDVDIDTASVCETSYQQLQCNALTTMTITAGTTATDTANTTGAHHHHHQWQKAVFDGVN